MMRWLGWSMMVLLLAGCAAAEPDPEGVLVLRGRVIDGTGAAPIEGGVVVVEGDRIRCVGTLERCKVPRGARELDAGEGTILPGLIDLHTHARSHYLWMYLAAGVTTARDLNNTFGLLDSLGHDGPDRVRVFWSGPLLDGPGSVIRRMGGEILEATTPAAARAAVDTLVARGAAVAKFYEQIPPEAYVAGASRAAERGLPVATDLGIQLTRGLSGAQVDALQALEAGVTSIEHLSGFALAYQRLGGDPTGEQLDPVLIDSLARAVVQHDAAVVPTLIVTAGFAAESLDFARGIPLADRLPEGMAEWWTEMHGSLTPAVQAKAAADLRLSLALLRRIHELGGRIGAGSDTPAGPFDVPGGGMHYELQLLVERAGLSPLEAIRAATGEAARILGRPELGVLAPGKVADIVVVNGNPAAEITATRELRWVMKAGQVFTLEELVAKGAPVPVADAGTPVGGTALLNSDAPTLDIPRAREPVVDGVISPGEWNDAAMVEITVEPGWKVPIHVMHDGRNLYVAFTNLKQGEAERYPEVLLAVRDRRDSTWTTNDWWLHASYQDCEGQGVFNNYQCSPTKMGWEANNFPLDPPGTIEFRISFDKIGLDPASVREIGVAFNVTDTRAVWSFWPRLATLKDPGSWAAARAAVGGGA